MEYRGSLNLPPATLLALSEHLRKTDSKMSIEEGAAAAIDAWLAAADPQPVQRDPQVPRGYQWKDLFLPDGTDARMIYDGVTCYARVNGDQLMFQGRRVSPRLFTQLVAPGVRNAWRDLWLRFPGTHEWKRAASIRKEQQKSTQPKPQSPAETINAAAACMAGALKTALTLVEQSNAQAVRKYERRLERHRRESDVMADHCSFD